MLVLSKVEEAPYRLGIRAKAFAPIAPVKVGLMLNGAEVGEITINSEWGVHELSVPEGLLTSGSYLSNRLLLRYAKIGRPSLLTEGTKDHRALSVGVDKVWLVPGDNR